jgi:lipoate---protein ligase
MYSVIVSDITCPYVNLAIEHQLLINVQKHERILFVFRNSPCVVIGRFQNPWLECNLALMQKLGVQLVRRQSGGGTVYHDLSNVNFSFIADKNYHDQKLNHQIVVKALQNLSVDAYATARGDIRLSDGTDRKISGSAFKQKKAQAFHHGTMLIKTDLPLLLSMITSSRTDLPTKSIASIRSQVANISEINPLIDEKLFQYELIKEFCEIHANAKISRITSSDLNHSHYEYETFLKDVKWKWQETPRFEVAHALMIENTQLVFNLVLNKGKIESWSSNIDNDELANFYQGKTLELASFQSSDAHPLLHQEIMLINQWLINYFDLANLP